MKNKLLRVSLSLALLANIFSAAQVSAAGAIDAKLPIYAGFEGTDETDFVKNYNAPGQDGWRIDQTASAIQADETVTADQGSVTFSTEAQNPASKGAGNTTGVRIEKKTAAPATIRLESGMMPNSVESFDSTKNYVISFYAKSTVAASFILINDSGVFPGNGWNANYTVPITSTEWQHYTLYLGPNTQHPDRIAGRRQIPRFEIAPIGVLCIDDFMIKEINSGVKDKELISDGGFEDSPLYNGQRGGVSYSDGAGTLRQNRSSLFEFRANIDPGNASYIEYSSDAAASGEYGLKANATGALNVEKTLLTSQGFDTSKVYKIKFKAKSGGNFYFMIVSAPNWTPGDSFMGSGGALKITSSASMTEHTIIWGPNDPTHPMYSQFTRTYNPLKMTGDPTARFYTTAADTLYLDDFSIEEIYSQKVRVTDLEHSITDTRIESTVTVKNNSATVARNIINIIGVLFDKNNKLRDFAVKEISLAADGSVSEEIGFNCDEDILSDGGRILYTVWDSITLMNPMMDNMVVDIKDIIDTDDPNTDDRFKYTTGFEGTNGTNFVKDYAVSAQYKWRADEYTPSLPAGGVVGAANGSVTFSTEAQYTASANTENTTGVRLERKAASTAAIRLEGGMLDENVESFDSTKNYVISFYAKSSVAANFMLVNDPNVYSDGGYNANYTVPITTSTEWQHYALYLGPNTQHPDRLAGRRHVPRFEISLGAGVLCIDDFLIKEINSGVEDKELVSDVGFEESPIYNGQRGGVSYSNGSGTLRPGRSSLFEFRAETINPGDASYIEYSSAAAASGNYGLKVNAVGTLNVEKSLLTSQGFDTSKVYKITFQAKSGGSFYFAIVSEPSWNTTYSFISVGSGVALRISPSSSMTEYTIIWGPNDPSHPLYSSFTRVYDTINMTGNPAARFYAEAADTLYLDDFSITEVNDISDISN